MQEGALIASAAAEAVQLIDHDHLHLTRGNRVPQTLHVWPVQVLTAAHLTVDVRFIDGDALPGAQVATGLLLAAQAGVVLLADAGDATVDGGVWLSAPGLPPAGRLGWAPPGGQLTWSAY